MFAHGFCTVSVTGAAQPQLLSAGRKLGVSNSWARNKLNKATAAPQKSPSQATYAGLTAYYVGLGTKWRCDVLCSNMVKDLKVLTVKC